MGKARRKWPTALATNQSLRFREFSRKHLILLQEKCAGVFQNEAFIAYSAIGPIVKNAIKISLVVGAVLNLINQGPSIFRVNRYLAAPVAKFCGSLLCGQLQCGQE